MSDQSQAPGSPVPPGAGGPAATQAQPGWGAPPPGYEAAPGAAPTHGAPPGYGPPPGYGTPSGYPVAPTGGGTKVSGGVVWSLLSIVAIALAVSLNEDGDNGWGRIGVWAGFAIVAAVVTLAPLVGSSINLSETRAWQVAAAGAIGLAGFWVLFVLPSIEQNVSFLATLGCVTGGLAAWSAPGRPRGDGSAGVGQTW